MLITALGLWSPFEGLIKAMDLPTRRTSPILKILHLCFLSLDMFQCLLVCSLWELEQNLYPDVARKIVINLNYTELVHSAFQIYSILPHFYLFILLILESLVLKCQLKILIYLKT